MNRTFQATRSSLDLVTLRGLAEGHNRKLTNRKRRSV